MPRPRKPVPTYALHTPSGQARVRVAGRDVYLGRYGSPESLAEYERVCGQLQAHAAAPAAATRPPPRPAADPTLDEVFAVLLAHAGGYYRRPDGTPTGEAKEFRLAVRAARPGYGGLPAAAFGPVALQDVRRRMVEAGWCRSRVNKQVGRLTRVFKWAAAQELVPAAAALALGCVAGLRRGRSAARETEPVRPVPDADLAATLPHLRPTVRAMVELQRLTGMRPGEVRRLRACDVDRSGEAWVYRPAAHKTDHLGRCRAVALGPRARRRLAPWLDRAAAGGRVFTLARAARRSKVPPSQRDRRKPPG